MLWIIWFVCISFWGNEILANNMDPVEGNQSQMNEMKWIKMKLLTNGKEVN